METERLRPLWKVLGLAVRIILLVLLLAGALIVALSTAPSGRTLGEFRAAAQADRVSQVVYRQQGGDVLHLVWSEGPLVWHEVQGLPVGDGPEVYSVKQFRREIGATSARVNKEEAASGSRGIFPNWPFRVPVTLGAWAVGAAWCVTFLGMLGSTPRWGNRWAWFWLFTVGQIGAILFLLLEPRPGWNLSDREPEPRARWDGRTGCLLSLGLGIASAVAAVGLGALAGLLLG
ncbi:hypothetical protein HS041_03765 [Planomonospora sp. ID67723]|uniref:hypothetical protein n=1 Tax=Planomonospora sp. ID67723 TaxID=2738134 RepID=UPI0018C3FCC4|nr:hypothetical protein [Planomonospora sp. ID67723]MBG0826889.1 hypothetical protein [Planomonospora sp. ID67723]